MIFDYGFFGQRMALKKQTICGKDFINSNTQILSPLAYLVKTLNSISNPQVTKAQCMLLGTSENIRLLSIKSIENSIKINQWLAGLIDADGSFLLSKKGYASLEITVDIRDSICLYKIKQIYGGSIKIRSGTNSIRYRLHHKIGLLQLIENVNGEIRSSNRMVQLKRICDHYNINFIYPKPLIYDNNWFAGFFDGDGTVTINKSNLQLAISVSQKNNQILEYFIPLFSGSIYIDKSTNTFKWYISKKEEILKLLNYFKDYPCYSLKKNRLSLIPRFYQLKELKNLPDFQKMITHFFNKWDLYR